MIRLSSGGPSSSRSVTRLNYAKRLRSNDAKSESSLRNTTVRYEDYDMKDRGSLWMSEVGYHSTQTITTSDKLSELTTRPHDNIGGRLFIATTELARCHRQKLHILYSLPEHNPSRRKYSIPIRGLPNNPE